MFNSINIQEPEQIVVTQFFRFIEGIISLH